jgi:hypothetical protein
MLKRFMMFGKNLVIKFISSLKRFPESILLATGFVAVMILLNHYDSSEQHDLLTRLAMIFALGIPLTLSFKGIIERLPHHQKMWRISFWAATAIGLALYFIFLLKDLKMVSIVRYTAFSIALYLAFIFIPYYSKRDNFELYGIHLLTNFVTTYFYSVILYLGLIAILFTVNTLFTLNLNAKLYFDIWLTVAGIFAPVVFLGGIPENKTELSMENYSKFLKILLLYIVMPIIVAYSAILYVYFGKIIISREWPVGIVANLVLWFSMISTIVIFFIYPLRNTNQWTDKFVLLFPKFIFPLLAMMFVAIVKRVQIYGITENRYFVIIAGLWVTGCMIYFTVSKSPRNINLLVSLAIITFLSVAGPWSCYSVSKISQNARFEKLLRNYHMIHQDSIIKPNRPLTIAAKREISSVLLYFDRYHSLHDVKYLPEDFKLNQMNDVFGTGFNHEIFTDSGRENSTKYYNELNDIPWSDIHGYDYFVDLSNRYLAKNSVNVGSMEIFYPDQSRNVTIILRGKEVYRKNVRDLALTLLRQYKPETKPVRKKMTYTDQNQNIKIHYIFKQISGTEDMLTGEIKLDYTEFYLLIKVK